MGILRIFSVVLLAVILLTIIAGQVLGYTYETKSDRQNDGFALYLVPALAILVLISFIIALITKRKPKETYFEIPDVYKNRLSADDKIIGQATWKNSIFIAADKRLIKCAGDNCEAISYEQISRVKKVFRISPIIAQVTFSILALITLIVAIVFWTSDSVPRLVDIGTTILFFDFIFFIVFAPSLIKVKQYEIAGKNIDPKIAKSWILPPDDAFADKLKKQVDDSRR